MARAPATGLARPPVAHVPLLDLTPSAVEVAEEVAEAWRYVVASSTFIGGPVVERFEREFAAYCGVPHAVGTANGTDALHLVLRALGVGPGDEVLVPANTFIATAAAVVLAGATPRFVDVDDRTLLMTPALAAQAVTPRTAAIVAVHLYGALPDMAGLAAVASRHGLLLLEDAAQAHGASCAGRRAGSFGRAATFSFYPGKNLGAYGDAGAVVTADAALADRVRSLANHGRRPGAHDDHVTVGTNSRLDALQAAVLTAKLPRLDAWNARRARHVERYGEALTDLDVRLVHPRGDGTVHHLAVVRVADRDAVRDHLRHAGVETGVHYRVPCHLAPAFAGSGASARPHLPVAERAAGEVLSLPLWPQLTDEQHGHVCRSLRTALGSDRA